MSADIAQPPGLNVTPTRARRGSSQRASAAPGLSWSRLIGIAIRDLRGETRGFLIFVLCIALGVAAIAGVGALTDALKGGLERQGVVLLGGDIELTRIHQRAATDERARMADLGTVSEVASLRAMARYAEPGSEGSADVAPDTLTESLLVEIKAVDTLYPLVGSLTLRDGATVATAVQSGAVAAVDPLLLDRTGLSVGDTIRVGGALVAIAGIIEDEPDKLGGRAAFGPRVMLSVATLEASGLAAPGSLTRWRYRISSGEGANLADGSPNSARAGDAPISDAVAKAFAADGYQVRDRRQPEPQVARGIGRLSQFLTLVGLTAMLVGGVGVANSVASYIDRKRKVIATFKSLGASNARVFAIYFIEVLVLALLGVAVGLLLGYALPFAISALYGDALPIALDIRVEPLTVFVAASYGLLVALLFVLWPLARAERIQPAVLFRDDVGNEAQGWPRWPYLTALLITLGALLTLAILGSGQRTLAAIFCAGVAVLFALFLGLGTAIAHLAERIPRPKRPELALAIGNLSGPGALTRSVVLSLGVGLSLLVTISLVDRSLVAELETSLPDKAPSYFFLDIDKNGVDAFNATVTKAAPTAKIETAPMLRGRIVAVGGTPSTDIKAESDVAWVLDGDRGLTFSAEVPEGSRVTEGTWWPADYAGPPQVSFGDEIAKGLGLNVGDTVTVNVLGRNITAEVANLRTVEWESLSINFVMVFSPNTLAAAPYKMLATVTYDERPDDAARAQLVRSVANAFPEVTPISVQDAIDTFSDVFNRIILAIRAAGAVTLLAGALVLAGALITAQRRRIYQAVVLKALGATRWRIIGANAAEYALLALITAGLATLVGGLAAWAITTQVLDLAFVPSFWAVVEAVGLASLLVLVFGGIGTWRVLQAPAAQHLRAG